jgi:5-methylcytosine-specific restriction endonuclease McrA
VKNPSPVTRARRTEMRRKTLGSDNPSCFYCPESDVACLEIEHPVGREYDKRFTRIVCRNCHGKLEMKRDVAQLTKNGQHRAPETEYESLLNYLLRLADDHEATSESLRRKVNLLSERGENGLSEK